MKAVDGVGVRQGGRESRVVLHLPAVNSWLLTLAGWPTAASPSPSVTMVAAASVYGHGSNSPALAYSAEESGQDTCSAPWHHSTDMFEVPSLPE